MARLFASLAGVLEARVRQVARRARLRAILTACLIVAMVLAVFFALGAATAALAARLGWVAALSIMAGVMLLAALNLAADRKSVV